MNKRDSYTSADAKPIKLMNNADVLSRIAEDGIVPPIHAQLILTNKCNLKCSFCSCSKDDRQTEMSFGMALRLVAILKEAGTKAITITGGGEPLLHPYFSEIVTAFNYAGIEIGLVSNGLLLNKLESSVLNKITWVRVSHSSERTFNLDYKSSLSGAIKKGKKVDWSFSYVVTERTRAQDVMPVVEFANLHQFTHVRLVADLFNPGNVDMGTLSMQLNNTIDDSLVIYQPRQKPERGQECFMGFLKPLIGANGMVYACCGVQYAFKEFHKSLPTELCLGTAGRLDRIINDSSPIDGSICYRCYYGEYNRTIKAMLSFADNVDHRNFL